jgi:hypothetical protein
MLSRSRLLSSLVVALLLSTLASADSVPVSIAYLHSSTGTNPDARSYSDHSSITQRSGMLMILAAFSSPSSEKPNAHFQRAAFRERVRPGPWDHQQKEWGLGCVAHARYDRQFRSVSYSGTEQLHAALNRPHRDCRSTAAKAAPRVISESVYDFATQFSSSSPFDCRYQQKIR